MGFNRDGSASGGFLVGLKRLLLGFSSETELLTGFD